MAQTFDIVADTASLQADLKYLADALARDARGELPLPLETRNRAFELVNQLIDGGPGFDDRFRLDAVDSPAAGASNLVIRVKVGPDLDDLLTAIRALDRELCHGGSPGLVD